MIRNNRLIQKSLLPLLLTSSLIADTTTLEHELLSLLDEATTIATNSKVNIVHQPSTVSVINYHDLQQKGFKNIHEAITSLPGFEGYITNIGWRELAVRGVYTANAYGHDKIKLLIDGVSVNNMLYGTIYYFLDFPIDLVERIEVLRGPGSVIYGTGAFSGAINIITKNPQVKGDRVFGGIDSYGYKILGGKQFVEEDGFNIYLDGYYQKDDKAIKNLTERRHSSNVDIVGETNEFLKDGSVGITVEKEDITITSRYKKSRSGDYYGNYEYEFGLDEDTGYNNTIFFLQGEIDKELENFNINFTAGYKFYEFDSEVYDAPKSKLIKDLNGKVREYMQDKNSLSREDAEALVISSGMYDYLVDSFYKHEKVGYFANEYTTYVKTSINTKYENHVIDFGIAHEYAINKKNYTSDNLKDTDDLKEILYAKVDGTELADSSMYHDPILKKENGLIGDDAKRTTNSIYLTDLYALNDSTDISAGYRVDTHSDIDKDHPSYNLGLVHRKSNELFFKFAHGSAFRAPSFIEIYSENETDFRRGNKNLKPENIKTTEFSVIYQPNNSFQLNTTLFYSLMNDAIDLAIDCEDLSEEDQKLVPCENSFSYTNYEKRTIKGLEVDYRHQLDSSNYLNMNYTKLSTFAKGMQPYVYATKVDISFVDISHELFNISYTYEFDNKLSFNTKAQYTDTRTQNAREETLSSSIIVDENINYRVSNDLFLQFSIKNLFNDRKYNQSAWGFHEDGLPREERYFALKGILEL